ncbi:MAG: hypothetical protein N0E59_00815 [Candidatus Thiodiazotropha taylori]|nr:hypothetical protein [Candidatus Thiodiazotropha taylori]MCG8109283.1 hypothetical protein [Candidatus Thiodiazotropha taylori]MCW4281621.1 hypothetical protein [Candidatus Thiodiazotropha taylori]MCW4303586.1 hypothetical protein [Candidatus Thiodiazotropha taylori]
MNDDIATFTDELMSRYDDTVQPAPTAGEMDPSNFEPQYPFTDGMETETDE